MATILIIFAAMILFNFLLLKFSCNKEIKKIKKTKRLDIKKETGHTLHVPKENESIALSSLKAS